MQHPTNLNDQHAWGGQHFPNDSQADTNEHEEPTVVQHTQQERFRPLSQADFIASNSDDLFHPVDESCLL